METVERSEAYGRKQVLKNRLATLEDLEALKGSLLLSIRAIIVQYAVPQQKKWLKSYEVKKLLGISSGTLQTLRSNGTIPFSKIGGTIYYDVDEVNRVLNEKKHDLGSIGNLFVNRKIRK